MRTEAVLVQYVSAEGVAQLAAAPADQRADAFRQALVRAVNQIEASSSAGGPLGDLPIVISGMAGSSIGWQELPYARLPLPLDGRGLVWRSLGPLALGRGQVLLVSGLASGDDVLRGEEIEALGAARLLAGGPLADEGILLLPGTHSKHIHVRAGHIVGFRTFMTGELFEVLGRHSVLRHSLANADQPADEGPHKNSTAAAASSPTPSAQELNYYRLKPVGWRKNRCSGLKSCAHDFVIRKLSPPSSGSVPSCWRMYSWITSSVTLPLDATKYPRAHRCRPQNAFCRCLNSISSFRELLPLMYCMILLGARLGGHDSSTCTWSRETEPSRISISLVRQTSRTSSRNRIPTASTRIGFRYFVIQTKWYFRSKRLCEPVRYFSIPQF